MGILTGKKVITFGDSIIDGHLYKKAGFMEFAAEQEGMEIRKYANNGACIMPGTPVGPDGLGGMILEQVRAAAEELPGYDPDYVVFDGGTNDAYEPILERLGDPDSRGWDGDRGGSGADSGQKSGWQMSSGFNSGGRDSGGPAPIGQDSAGASPSCTDTGRCGTFADAFRKTVRAIQKNWPRAKVIYTAVHRLGYRDRAVQEALHKIVLSVCSSMGVTVANLYDDCRLDTSDAEMCRKYSFDMLKDGLPAPGEHPTGTHPNLEAIREFYVPFITDTLRRAEQFRFREVYCDPQEDSAMLYWELPEHSEAGDIYQIRSNGRLAGETCESHYRLDGLEPGHTYAVTLCAVREGRTLAEVKTFCTAKLKKQRLDVTKAPYFAAGDGVTLNTAILQRAIDDCGPGQAVYLPSGSFLTGALRLHSDMELYLEKGAVLKGSANPEDYLPRVKSRFEGIELETLSGLLNLGELDHDSGCTLRNVVIRGEGTIEGGGMQLAERVIAEERGRLNAYLESLGTKIGEYENENTIPGRIRPRLLHICNAENISISGITLKNGACWNVHMIYSRNILTYDCSFYSRNIWNGDGWDPDSSENCVIFGCTFDTGDDAVAVKSGKNPEGNQIGRPCEHIRIFDCKCLFGHGFAIGSEISGGIRDVKIWNCDLRNSAYGVEIKGTRKRGGYVREISASRCTVPRILVHSVTYNDDGTPADTPPVFERLLFSDLEITGQCLNEETGCSEPCGLAELCGFEEEGHHLRDVVFRNIRTGDGSRGMGGMRMKHIDSVEIVSSEM